MTNHKKKEEIRSASRIRKIRDYCKQRSEQSPWLLARIVPFCAAKILWRTVFIQQFIFLVLMFLAALLIHNFNIDWFGLLMFAIAFSLGAVGATIRYRVIVRCIVRYIEKYILKWVVYIVCTATLVGFTYWLLDNSVEVIIAKAFKYFYKDSVIYLVEGNVIYLVLPFIVIILLIQFRPLIKKSLSSVKQIQAFGVDLKIGGEDETTLPIASFKDLMSALSDLLSGANTDEDIRFTAYTPAVGRLAREDFEWDRLYENMALNIHKMHFTCLTKKELESWHNKFKNRFNGRGHEIDIVDCGKATKDSELLLDWAKSSGEMDRVKFSDHPQYYLFSSKKRAILVVPFFVPKINGSDDDTNRRKGYAVEMAGIVTSDKHLLELVQKEKSPEADNSENQDDSITVVNDDDKLVVVNDGTKWLVVSFLMAQLFLFVMLAGFQWLPTGWPECRNEYIVLVATYLLALVTPSYWLGCSHFKRFDIYIPIVILTLAEIFYWLMLQELSSAIIAELLLVSLVVIGGLVIVYFMPEIRKRLEKVTVINAFGIRMEFPENDNSQQSATLPLTSFKDLMAALSDMLKSVDKNKNNGATEKIRFTAYTPALGYLACETNEWKKLKDLLQSHAEFIEMTSLNIPISEDLKGKSDLEKWHSNFKGMLTRRGEVSEELIKEANSAAQEIKENIICFNKKNWTGSRYSDLPQYYLFASESRAILVVPFNAPKVDDSPNTVKPINMVGLVTGDKKIVNMIKEVHDHHHK
jgi:DNA integrity scanning protein DisA with diadenylate cyclase activity